MEEHVKTRNTVINVNADQDSVEESAKTTTTNAEEFIVKMEEHVKTKNTVTNVNACLLYTSPSPRDKRQSRMPSSA